MKSEKLLDAIGMVGDDLIDEARAPQKKVIQWKHWTAIAACLAVLIGILAIAKPFSQTEPNITGSGVLQSNPNNTDDTTIDPTDAPYDPGQLMQLSASPDKAYIGIKQYNPTNVFVSLPTYFLWIEARAVETLPDTYITYSDWDSTPLRIVKMQTLSSYEEQNVPREFYLVFDAEFFVDFTQYDSLVLPYLHQYGAENTILYNVSQRSAEMFDLLLLGCNGFDAGSCIYAFKNGSFDISLWTINDVWSKATEFKRQHGVKFNTPAEAKAYFWDIQSSYYKDFKAVYRSDVNFQDGITALDYVAPFKNGIYVIDGSAGSTNNFSYRRYINGIPTNERVVISVRNKTANYYGTAFTQADMDSLPDVASAIVTIEDAFQNGQIVPPHIAGYQEMDLRTHGVTGWYFKSGEEVYGAVQVGFTFYDEFTQEFRYDDIYFLMEPGSNICTKITRDELWQLQGTDDFIYTGKYDEYGKVPKDVI